MTTTLKEKLDAVRQQMIAVVLAAATEKGKVGFRTHYMDNYWTIEVDANGVVRNADYAADGHGKTRRVEQLATWELGHLIGDIESDEREHQKRFMRR